MEKWPEIKPTVSGGVLPQWEHRDGTFKGGQARSVMRFLGLKYGYYPDDPLRAQECDMIVDGYYDVFGAGTDAAVGVNNDPSTCEAAREKYLKDVLPKFLTILEPFCARG